MPVCCDVCGIEALESQEFAQERLPFCRLKRYCPACHKRLYHRAYLVLALVPLFLGTIGLVEVLRGSKSFLQGTGMWFACLCVIQWLMILPHELGHATLARLFRYNQIRILVGVGRQLFSARLLGFSWLFNLIPMGGLTISNPSPKTNRWKHLSVVAAGPMVNVAVAALAFLFVKPGRFYDGIVTWPKLIFWANLIVLGENLFPYVIQTPFGPVGTDGLQLWHLLFQWNKSLKNEPERVPLWELILSYCLKWFIFLITLTTCLLLGFFGLRFMFWPFGVLPWASR